MSRCYQYKIRRNQTQVNPNTAPKGQRTTAINESKTQNPLSWSSGKDSVGAAHLRQDPQIELAGLFCTVNQAFNRVAMHGVRVELLQRQADRLGLLRCRSSTFPIRAVTSNTRKVMSEFVTRRGRRA